MNSDLERVLASNAKLSEEMSKSFTVVAESLSKTKFKFVSKALLSFIPRGGYLMNSILSSCQSNDIYSSSILFRALIEHSFRHLYIYTKALNDNSDSVGDDYCNSLKANEDLESWDKIINYKKVIYPDDAKWNTRGEHNNLIRETAKQFRIKQIFYYLIGNNNKGRDEVILKAKKEYLLERLIEYTNISSSVHGGSFGWFAFTELQKDKPRFEGTLNKLINDAFLLHNSIVETTYLFASLMDDTNKKHYEGIRNISHT